MPLHQFKVINKQHNLYVTNTHSLTLTKALPELPILPPNMPPKTLLLLLLLLPPPLIYSSTDLPNLQISPPPLHRIPSPPLLLPQLHPGYK